MIETVLFLNLLFENGSQRIEKFVGTPYQCRVVAELLIGREDVPTERIRNRKVIKASCFQVATR